MLVQEAITKFNGVSASCLLQGYIIFVCSALIGVKAGFPQRTGQQGIAEIIYTEQGNTVLLPHISKRGKDINIVFLNAIHRRNPAKRSKRKIPIFPSTAANKDK